MKSSEMEELYKLFQLKEKLEHNIEVLYICDIDCDVNITFTPNTQNYSGGKKMSIFTYRYKWEQPLAKQIYKLALDFYKQKHDETLQVINQYGRVDYENDKNKI